VFVVKLISQSRNDARIARTEGTNVNAIGLLLIWWFSLIEICGALRDGGFDGRSDHNQSGGFNIDGDSTAADRNTAEENRRPD
jgi:hypothetical protein